MKKKKTPVTSTEFYEELKKLFPGLADQKNVTNLKITLAYNEPVVVEVTSWAECGFGFTETKKFNLTERE